MGLTDTVFGTPGTTTTQQAPGTKPPGYQFARDFYNSLGQITSNPFPTYQGNLDPGLSPTLQNLLRQAQGYAQSGPPEILAGVQGSLGQFMNPSFANPVARMQFGAPDYFDQNPNQTVYNGGTVNGLAGVFGQSQQGSSMPSMSAQPGQMNLGMQGGYQANGGTPPIYAGGQQPGQPPANASQNVTQGLQNAFLQNAKPLQGFPGVPPGVMQGIGGLSGTDQLQHMAGGAGGWTPPSGLQFPGQPGEINFQWPTSGPGANYNPGLDGNFHGVDPGTGWMPNGQFPLNPGAQHPGMPGGAPGGHTYGGYSVDQLQQHPELAQRLGAHAAGLWRAFSGQPGGGDVRPTGRHPLNRPPTKPLRDPATGGIANPGGRIWT